MDEMRLMACGLVWAIHNPPGTPVPDWMDVAVDAAMRVVPELSRYKSGQDIDAQRLAAKDPTP